MIRSINKDVTVAAYTETLQTFVTGIEGKVRKVKSIWFEQVADVDLRGYLQQDRVVDVGEECGQCGTNHVPVDLEVPMGQSFKAGFQNNTAGSITQKVTVFVEEN